jgi:K+ transporter
MDEGSPFFCKSFVSSGLRGLSSLMGKDSVITFKISAISAVRGVKEVSSVASVIFGSGVSAFLFFKIVAFGSGVDFLFFEIF